MANIPDVIQIAGKHLDTYEAYYKGLDPKGTNNVGALDAAKFLKKSGLSDVVLSRVWDLSDPAGRGSLDKRGVFVALKLVSLAQAGERIDVKNLTFETNAPRCGDIPKVKPPPVPKMTAPHGQQGPGQDWSIKPEEKQKYVTLFNSMHPENGQLPGGKVVGLLKESKLPVETLSQVWELADQDKDGSLDEHEFIVAMHLVYKALDRRAIPSSLPRELQKQNLKAEVDGGFVANFPKDIVPIAPVIPGPGRPPAPAHAIPALPKAPSSVASGDWVLSTVEKLKFQELFEKCDLDKDGMVSGVEIKDVFLKSGLQTNMLAHIWALCDTDQSGKLNNEQFALACWFIDRKKKGIDPPPALAPEMIPPSMRPDAVKIPPPRPVYSNPELEMISKEIDELTKERHTIEAEVAQKEADIRIKNGEIRSLQSELDTLTATLKQLESQKDAAGKKLEELKATKCDLDNSIELVKEKTKLTAEQVNKLREQCQKQEETIKEQETELYSKREELQKLKDEEDEVQKEYDESVKEKDRISNQLSDTQLQISQVRSMITQVEEVQRQMNDALAVCKAAVEENNASVVSDYSLQIEPDFREIRTVLVSPEEKPKTPEAKPDPFKPATRFDDNFESKTTGFADDDSWNANSSWNTPATNDPFAASTTPYDQPAKNNGKDAFDSDPFAALHAPPKGSNPADSPALPPKAKAKPPRPAPPRPAQGPKIADSFGSSSFANFDDFDNKVIAAPEVAPKLPAKRSVPPKVAEVVAVARNPVVDDSTPAPVEFNEDPFKNYRYEDPFMIADPFQEEDEELEDKKNENEVFDITSAFDKFSLTDPFKNTQNESEVVTNGNNMNNNNNFDPFGLSESTTTQLDSFDPFGMKNGTKSQPNSDSSGFKFDTEFANFDAFNGNNVKSTNGDFDAWGESVDKKNNNFSTGKVKKSQEAEVKKIRKFSADYSENFGDDIEQVLKRSMVEK